MMNVRGIQRNMKNVVKNYSDAQVKVREATSNDPWGPSSTLMSEIADLTYNVVAFSEIMQMIWKRLNDHGKNWRHVYKALVLLEYLIKTGSEKVAMQCKENIFAIQTLKDFQHIEENKDQGLNVREKSKALVALLKDDEKLRNERTRALKAKERFAQSISYAADSNVMVETVNPKTSLSYHESLGGNEKSLSTDLECARPQTAGEEELQLQLALAMSKEEAEQEEKLRKNDDLRLQLAISESQKRAASDPGAQKKSAVDDLSDLLTLGAGAVGGVAAAAAAASNDPWPAGQLNGAVGGVPAINDPWSASPPVPSAASGTLNDPWAPSPSTTVRSSSATNDPWQPSPPPTQPAMNDAWMPSDIDTAPSTNGKSTASHVNTSGSPETLSSKNAIRKTPESFLGANSNLVNLDALVSSKGSGGMSSGGNPFASSTMVGSLSANPFQAAKPAAPTINQLRSQGTFTSSGQASGQLLGGGTFTASTTASVPFGGPSPAFDTHLPASNLSLPSGHNPFSL